MKYQSIDGTWCNDDTVTVRPVGATAMTEEQWENRLGAAPPPTADEMWVKIKAERDRRIQNGGYNVGTKWYHSDTFSRTQQMGLVMMGANIPANTPWKTMDGTFVVMTQTLAGQIFGTAAASDIAIFTAAETHNAAMRASATPHTYNYLTGWPTAYGE